MTEMPQVSTQKKRQTVAVNNPALKVQIRAQNMKEYTNADKNKAKDALDNYFIRKEYKSLPY